MNINLFMRLGVRFFLLQVGTVLSQLSGHVCRLSLAWWCLKETHSAITFSTLIAFSVAAEIYLKPFIATLGDVYNRIKLIVLCQLAVLIIIFMFCVISLVGSFNITIVGIGLITMSSILSLREPTITGLIPDLVEDGEISRAIAYRSAVGSFVMLLGPVLAALIISLYSAGVALYVSVVLQSLSCVAFIIISKKEGVVMSVITNEDGLLSKIKDGFYAIYHVKPEYYLALISAIINFTMFPFFSVTVPYWISTELQLPASYLGAFELSFSIGLIAGSINLNALAGMLVGRFLNVLAGFLLLGGSVIGIVMAPSIYVSIAFAFFSGLAFIFINVNLSSLRVSATPRHYRTRMSAMASFISSMANPFGLVIAGWCTHRYGVTPFAVFSGGIVILVSPILLWLPKLKIILSLTEGEMRGYYEKEYPEAFNRIK
ncbi:TPA: MFS transporter [Serratia marcescens]